MNKIRHLYKTNKDNSYHFSIISAFMNQQSHKNVVVEIQTGFYAVDYTPLNKLINNNAHHWFVYKPSKVHIFTKS